MRIGEVPAWLIEGLEGPMEAAASTLCRLPMILLGQCLCGQSERLACEWPPGRSSRAHEV